MKDFRPLIFYGIVLALLVFALKWLQWKFMIVDHSVDIYVGLIAIFFTLLGVWISSQLVEPARETVVIELREDEFVRNEQELKRLDLSSREYEVLQLIAKGYSNAEIANELFLSLSTIKTHVSNLFFKMEVKSRTKAIDKAKMLGIIP